MTSVVEAEVSDTDVSAGLEVETVWKCAQVWVQKQEKWKCRSRNRSRGEGSAGLGTETAEMTECRCGS